MLKKILAISGSTRKTSTNLRLIRAITTLSAGVCQIEQFDGLADIPHFNPDLDGDQPPDAVVHFRALLRAADGVLICTPEYAMGVPGTLKNAIDWTVSSCEFAHKPTALITAASMGQKSHLSLLETLRVIEANVVADTQLVISFAGTKINMDCAITDELARLAVERLMTAFTNIIQTAPENRLRQEAAGYGPLANFP